MSDSDFPVLREIDSTIDWWRDAGVDQSFEDDATAWLKPAAEPPANDAAEGNEKRSAAAPAEARDHETAPAKKISPAAPDLFDGAPPQSLDSFREWWLGAAGLDQIGPRGRIAPRGVANPQLMVVVVDPEEQDREQLLSGPQGKLLDAILAALGLSHDQTYLASALTRHTPMADTQAAADAGMASVLAHHIGLVAPERVLAFGGNILPLIGNNSANSGKNLPEINSTASNTPLLVNEGLDSLMASPRLKARFWRRSIEWLAD